MSVPVWNFTLDLRPKYGTVEARYFDCAQGQQCKVKHQTGFTGLVVRLRNCYPYEEEALTDSVSESDRPCRAVGSSSLMLEERPKIMAGQHLLLQWFRDEINGSWKAATITHRYDKARGYTKEITLEALNKGKEAWEN